MSKALLLICFLFAPVISHAQHSIPNEYTAEIRTDKMGQFSNLSVLDIPLSGVQVVTLGEQTHFDGGTFDAKIQLIKYLHEVLGFDVLAFESGYYDCTKAGEILASNSVSGTLKEAVFGVWDTKALADLEQYIIATQKTARPLRITGFDAQFSGKLSGKYFMSDLNAFISKIGGQKILQQKEWSGFEAAVKRQIKYSNFYKKPSIKDTMCIAQVCKQLEALLDSKAVGLDKNTYHHWKKILANLVFDTKHRYGNNNHRDSVMAVNLLSLINDHFPDEKVICWGATAHFIYNPEQITSSDYADFVPMGDYLHKALGARLFTIGFTSYDGRYGSMITRALKPPPLGSYEHILGKTSYQYAFTDLRSASKTENDGIIMQSRMLGNRFIPMVLTKIVDGLFYIRTAYPAPLK